MTEFEERPVDRESAPTSKPLAPWEPPTLTKLPMHQAELGGPPGATDAGLYS